MKSHTLRIPIAAACFAAALSVTSASFAQISAASPAAISASSSAAPANPMDPEMMKQMMEMSKLNENHKQLGELAGNWNYTVKMWMAPGAPAIESKGSGSRKPIMGGRYYLVEANGMFKMPDETGKLKDFKFTGMSIEGYDNVKKKFVSSWVDNMGTGILYSEGTYDPANKAYTYEADSEMMPGMKTHMRQVLKVADKDHHTFEFYDNSSGADTKTMEISYTRKK